jgi:heme-degrading monooxygenase HmoA
MYARVVTLKFQAGKEDEAANAFRDLIVPTLKQQQGFKGAVLMTDESTKKGLAITYWDTQANLLATESSNALLEQMAQLGQIVSAPPTSENFLVNFQV